ncbi:uncharacterized protein PAC_12586 [Phialocephala subalpina]|uniref:Uncharacterized protein n=1 Tax=Phialocephala subalpina TaxID=576137 RepID=A0A1L7XCD0_9HELO|nr:uncharacterized protein PAC_12586 [Phialocephala subalpina]
MSKLRPDGSFHSGTWDATLKRPIVAQSTKIQLRENFVPQRKPLPLSPTSPTLTTIRGDQYFGPPDVDILITNIHESGGTYRSARPFPLEKVLWQVMKVVREEGLEIHASTATTYGVTLVFAHELDGRKGFSFVTDRISNGLWGEA